jgi:hypothetical protein
MRLFIFSPLDLMETHYFKKLYNVVKHLTNQNFKLEISPILFV